MRHAISTAAFGAVLLFANACTPEPRAPSVHVHYVGHAAFLLTFDDGLTALTDFGKSNAYGLDSPVYELGSVVPDVVTRSHEHADHAGDALPAGIGRLVTGGERFERQGLTVTPIATYEGSLDAPDNTSYLFEYRGLTILHMGDCQALILASGDSTVRQRVRELYPDTYDLVLLPIGFVSDIVAEAADFVTLLDARRVIPMHYWSPVDRDRFLERLAGRADHRGRPYRTRALQDADFTLEGTEATLDTVEVVGLTPAPVVTQ